MKDRQITAHLIDENFLYLIRNTLFCTILYFGMKDDTNINK